MSTSRRQARMSASVIRTDQLHVLSLPLCCLCYLRLPRLLVSRIAGSSELPCMPSVREPVGWQGFAPLCCGLSGAQTCTAPLLQLVRSMLRGAFRADICCKPRQPEVMQPLTHGGAHRQDPAARSTGRSRQSSSASAAHRHSCQRKLGSR